LYSGSTGRKILIITGSKTKIGLSINDIKCHLDECKRSINAKQAPETLQEGDNTSVLNLKQLALFNRALNHHTSRGKEQLLLQVDNEAEIRESLCIEMISKHMHYHAQND
jgi:DNA-binding transcriptional MerR regulator